MAFSPLFLFAHSFPPSVLFADLPVQNQNFIIKSTAGDQSFMKSKP